MSRIQLRRDSVTNWLTVNPVLALGELGIAYDGVGADAAVVTIRIGNGVATWTQLPDFGGNGDLTQEEADVLYASAAQGLKADTALQAGPTVVEYVQDIVAAMSVGGQGVQIAYNDSLGTITFSVSSLAITEVFPVSDQAAMLALAAQRGDVAIRSDVSAVYILSTDDPTQLANWILLPTPLNAVLSVNGLTGAVTISPAALGLGNVTNTSDADKPVSTLQAQAIAAAIAAAATDATAKADAKVADAINDGTTTVAPSQNAVYDALATKADLASPALTGNPTAPTQTVGDNSTRIATTAFVAASWSTLSATAVSTVPATTGLDPASTDVEAALTELAARPSGGGTFPTPHPLPLTSGTYSVPGFLASGIRTTLVWNGNRRLDFYPIIVQKALAVDAMQCYVYTAGGAGSLCMLGLYTADNNFKPLDKIEQSVSMNSATTGSKVATFAERVLEPGYYVLGLNVNVADATGPVMLGMGYHAPFLSGDGYSSVLSYRIPGAPFSMPDGPLAPSVESIPNSGFPMYAFLRVLRFADD